MQCLLGCFKNTNRFYLQFYQIAGRRLDNDLNTNMKDITLGVLAPFGAGRHGAAIWDLQRFETAGYSNCSVLEPSSTPGVYSTLSISRAGQAFAEAKLEPVLVRNLVWPPQLFQSTLGYTLEPTYGLFVTDSHLNFTF